MSTAPKFRPRHDSRKCYEFDGVPNVSEEAAYVGDRFVLAVCLVAFVLFIIGVIR